MTDRDIRNGAMQAVQRLWRRHGDAVPWTAINSGFNVGGERIPLLSPAGGVYKPRQMDLGVLSIKTTIRSKYDDTRVSDDRVWYEYSPEEYLNAGLRENLKFRLPVLYFLQVKPRPGVEYLIFAPVDIEQDDPAERRFLINLSPSALYEDNEGLDHSIMEALRDEQPLPADLHRAMERKYGSSTVRTRRFQAYFRQVVLDAYDRRCGVCALGEKPILDGAHLVPDREELGEPKVSNGISLCVVHHRAFDRDLMGITPNYTVHVFRDRLQYPDEDAGKVLTSFHGAKLRVPSDSYKRPDPDLVEWRWQSAVAS